MWWIRWETPSRKTGLVTLREAIEAANTNAIVGDAHAGSANETDVIKFSPEVFGGRIALGQVTLMITEAVEIQGPGGGQADD